MRSMPTWDSGPVLSPPWSLHRPLGMAGHCISLGEMVLESLKEQQIDLLMKRTIAVVTSSRADYGHLYWPLRDLSEAFFSR